MITTYHGKNTYYARKQITERTRKTDPLNVVHLDTPNLKELSEEVSVSPIFATRRSIIVHSLKNLGAPKGIIGVLESKRDTSHVVFVIEEYGKKYEKLAAYLRKSQVIKIPLFDAKKAKLYAEWEAKRQGIHLDTIEVMDYFLFLVGNDPESIDIELSNLAQQPDLKDKKIAILDLRKHVSRRTNTIIFSATQAIFLKEHSEAIGLVEQFIGEKPDNLMSLLHMLTSDISLGLMIKTTRSISQIPANPYRVKLLRKSMKNYNMDQLVQFFLTINNAIYKSRIGTNPLPIFYRGLYEFRK